MSMDPECLGKASMGVNKAFLTTAKTMFKLASIVFLVVALVKDMVATFSIIDNLVVKVFTITFVSFTIVACMKMSVMHAIKEFHRCMSILESQRFYSVGRVTSTAKQSIEGILGSIGGVVAGN